MAMAKRGFSAVPVQRGTTTSTGVSDRKQTIFTGKRDRPKTGKAPLGGKLRPAASKKAGSAGGS